MWACTPFSQVGWYRQSGSSQLICQIVEILLGKAIRKLIDLQSQLIGLLPNIQLSIALDHHYSAAASDSSFLPLLPFFALFSLPRSGPVTPVTVAKRLLPLPLHGLVTLATSPCHFCHRCEAALSLLLQLLLPLPGRLDDILQVVVPRLPTRRLHQLGAVGN